MPSCKVGGWLSWKPTPGTVCLQVCSLCNLPHWVQKPQVQLEASLNCLGFLDKPHSGKVTMINSIFSWSLYP